MGRVSARSVFWGQRNLEWTYVKNTPWPLLLFTLPGHVLYNVAATLYFARCWSPAHLSLGKMARHQGTASRVASAP